MDQIELHFTRGFDGETVVVSIDGREPDRVEGCDNRHAHRSCSASVHTSRGRPAPSRNRGAGTQCQDRDCGRDRRPEVGHR